MKKGTQGTLAGWAGAKEESKETPKEDSEKSLEKSTQKVKTSQNGVEKSQEDDKNDGTMLLESIPKKKIEKSRDYKAESSTKIESDTYDPKKNAPFNKNEPAPFFFICECFDLISEMKGANSVERKKRIFINMFKTFETLNPEELADFYLFSTGRLDAEYIQKDLGVGGEIMSKATAEATTSNPKVVKEEVSKIGDLGMVFQQRKSKTQTVNTFFSAKADTKRLTFQYVFESIKELTQISGSKDKKQALQGLLYNCTGVEGKFVIRFLEKGNFRMGCAKATIQSSLARSFYEKFAKSQDEISTPEEWEKALQKCSHQFPNYRLIVKALQESKGDPTSLYKKCKLTSFIPCKPMLAKPTKDIRIIFKRFEGKPFTCEYKYDGLRGQIHYKNGEVIIYSRNLENMTAQYPDVAKNIKECVKEGVTDFIVDSEIVGIDQKTVDFI